MDKNETQLQAQVKAIIQAQSPNLPTKKKATERVFKTWFSDL